MNASSKAPQWLNPVTEYGPLAVFLAAYWFQGLMVATGALMAATVVALALGWLVARKVPVTALVTAVVVGIFGGLTLWLHDETFIKMKPTLVMLLFAAALGLGVVFGRLFLKMLMGQAFPELSDTGWRGLTWRFVALYIVLAGLNELVWRTQTTDVWVSFKVFGLIGLTFAFMLAQWPYLKRHSAALADPD